MKLTHDYSTEYARLCKARSSPEIIEDFWTGLRDVLVGQFGVHDSAAAAIARSLLARMDDDRLRYHTPLHVLSLFSWAARRGVALSAWEQLVIWFHDAIYEPLAGPGENEARSAAFTRALLAGYVKDEVIARVEWGIEGTGLHLRAQVSPELHTILDLDICNFAWDRRNFAACSAAVAAEFLPVVGRQRYLADRHRFFADLLARGFIFRSPLFRQGHESKARANIQRLLKGKPVRRRQHVRA